MTSCMDACNQPDNAQKCMEVFKQAGIDTGEGSYSNEPPEVWCPKAGPYCKWDGTNCVCLDPQACQKNPGCSWTGTNCECTSTNSTPEPGEVWCPKIGPYCVWDGSSCTCWDDCIKAGGAWTGSRCDFPQESGEVWCPKAGPGCSWDGTRCICPGSDVPVEGGVSQPTPEPPEVWCPRNPGCQWTGDTCLCEAVLVTSTPEPSPSPAVQGITTSRGLLQQILDFILGR